MYGIAGETGLSVELEPGSVDHPSVAVIRIESEPPRGRPQSSHTDLPVSFPARS